MARSLFSRPRLFISYSRKDEAFAKYLYQALTEAGYDVFYDVEKLLVGEDFVDRIRSQLSRCHGVVAILSRDSAASEWCQAELYHAHALGKIIAPVRLGKESFQLASPLDQMHKSINYVAVEGEQGYPKATHQIVNRLKTVRRMVYRAWIQNGIGLIAAAALLVLGFSYAINQINSLSQARERKEVENRLMASNTTLNREIIQGIAGRFEEDETLASRLYLLSANPELSDLQRLNADILLTEMQRPGSVGQRWFIENVDWNTSDYTFGKLSDVTFMKGSILDVQFQSVSFGGVVWSSAPSPEQEGLSIGGSKFDFCYFNGCWFAGTGAVSVDFENCRFKGTRLEVEGFGAVHFYSAASDTSGSVITNEVSIFENCTIQNCIDPPEPGVLEILEPDSEVRFTEVVFDACHFRGFIRPSWFTRCTFMDCIFPPGFPLEELEKSNPVIQNCIFHEEDCY